MKSGLSDTREKRWLMSLIPTSTNTDILGCWFGLSHISNNQIMLINEDLGMSLFFSQESLTPPLNKSWLTMSYPA